MTEKKEEGKELSFKEALDNVRKVCNLSGPKALESFLVVTEYLMEEMTKDPTPQDKEEESVGEAELENCLDDEHISVNVPKPLREHYLAVMDRASEKPTLRTIEQHNAGPAGPSLFTLVIDFPDHSLPSERKPAPEQFSISDGTTNEKEGE